MFTASGSKVHDCLLYNVWLNPARSVCGRERGRAALAVDAVSGGLCSSGRLRAVAVAERPARPANPPGATL